MNLMDQLKKFVTVIGMACVIVCGCAGRTFAQQPPVASVVQSLPRDTSGAYLVSAPRGVPIATINVTATEPDPCDIGFDPRPAHPMLAGLMVTDQGAANPARTPGVVLLGTITGTPTAQGTFTSVLQADGATASRHVHLDDHQCVTGDRRDSKFTQSLRASRSRWQSAR